MAQASDTRGSATPLGRRAVQARTCLWGVIAVDVAMEVIGFSSDRGFAFARDFGDFVYLGTSLVTAVFFLRWFHLAMQSAIDRGVALEVSPFRAVTFWFIPIVNFIRPYQLLRRALAALKAPTRVVTLWQVCWFVGGVVSIWQAPRSLLGVTSTGLDIAAAVLAVRVIDRVTSTVASERSPLQTSTEG
jgi:hypothetical protein